MSRAAEMLRTHPADLGGIDRKLLAACIDACLECAQACTACADACLGEPSVADLVTCIRTNLDCADVCAATERLLSRYTGAAAETARAMLMACATACRGCGNECARHAGTGMDHCRVCAEACRHCEDACAALLASL